MFRKLISETRYILEGGGSRASKLGRQSMFYNSRMLTPATSSSTANLKNWRKDAQVSVGNTDELANKPKRDALKRFKVLGPKGNTGPRTRLSNFKNAMR